MEISEADQPGKFNPGIDFKKRFEHYNRFDPLSTFDPAHDDTYQGRVRWFARRVSPGARVLDDGCGQGVILAGLAQRPGIHPESWGVDISENAIRKASARYPTLKFRCANPDGTLPFPGASFETVVTSEMIDHAWDPEALFLEFSRVLRPSGSLLLSTGYHGFFKDLALLLTGQMAAHYHDPRSDKIRHYAVNMLRPLLADCGLRLVEWDGMGRIPGLWKCLMVYAVKA